MISENRQHGYGKVFNDVRLLSTDDKPTDVRNGSTLIEIDTGRRYLFDADSMTWNQYSSGGGGGGGTEILPIPVATIHSITGVGG